MKTRVDILYHAILYYLSYFWSVDNHEIKQIFNLFQILSIKKCKIAKQLFISKKVM